MQSLKIFRLKEVKDVSVWTYAMIFIIGILWLSYGLQINSISLIVGNAIKLLASLSVVIVYLVYRKQ